MKLSDEELRRRAETKKLRIEDEEARKKKFGENLSRLIKVCGLSQSRICRETGIDPNVLYRYSRGWTSPKAYNVVLLAKTLKVNFWDLYPL